MNLRSIDLNLLVVFEALIEERSVSNAAARIGMTQSAVSHALKRLRITFNDDLLVRTAGGMEPTPHAIKLAHSFRGALSQIEGTIKVRTKFDPATASETFYLSMSDYVRTFLLPRLCKYLQESAPGISLVVEAPHAQQISSTVAFDGLQVRLASERSSGPVTTLRLMDDTFSVLMRTDHPLAAMPLTLARYLQLGHVKVTGVGSSAIDEALTLQGLARNVVFKLPSWLETVAVVETTDLVVAMPSHWRRNSIFMSNCVAKPLPLKLAMPIEAAWHPRNDYDPAHQWLRATVQRLFTIGECGPEGDRT
jgi:DNA-binding transcriptional LysR family regulator